jgi:hypothetical protein
MRYRDHVRALTRAFQIDAPHCALPGGLVVQNEWFESHARSILPGRASYTCKRHDVDFEGRATGRTREFVAERLHEVDGDIAENKRFRYSIFAPASAPAASGVIFLFHGLNERDWSKYLPWATRLVELTGKAVILFPLAFHMNRAPAEWSRPQLMRNVSADRKGGSPTLANSTFANAAISARLQAYPGRFCWSGLQTFHDVVQLVDEIRDGRHAAVRSDATVDFFAYSIGAFLCEILLMADPDGRFSDSRMFLFCGGSTLDRTYPNSRYILDSDATIALYSFFLARFDNELLADDRLAHYMSSKHPEGRYFRAMLSYHDQKEVRESRFAEMSSRVAALALRRDTVIPANEVLNTLTGDFRDIPIRVDVTDFEHDHSHVVPFPLNTSDGDVERALVRVFTRAAEHLG